MEIIKFLVILLVLVSVHELGHFIMAKLFNVYVTEFALGFGPKIFSYKGKETEFTVRLLPLGGFAAMVGEDGEISEDLAHVPFERTLKGVNKFRQFLIMFAGSFMNLLLALLIFTGIAFTNDTASPKPIIGEVTTNSAAAKAGLKKDDIIKKAILNNKETKVKTYLDLIMFTTSNKEGKPYELLVNRDKNDIKLKITPTFNKEEKRYISGFSQKVVKANKNPIGAIKTGFDLSIDAANQIFTSLKMLFTGKAGVKDLSGPVGMVDMTKKISAKSGVVGLVNFAALLSVNLGIFNLLPIPALDGGRILIILIEAITRRKINPELENKIIGFSFMLLMALIVYVTFNDITKMFFK